MALVMFGVSTCPLCGGVLREGELRMATSPFSVGAAWHLLGFVDAAMHRSCFAEWEHRDEFVRAFNEDALKHAGNRRVVNEMRPDGTVGRKHRRRKRS